MTTAIDIDRRDLSEMTAYHEARIEALQREHRRVITALLEIVAVHFGAPCPACRHISCVAIRDAQQLTRPKPKEVA